MPIDSTMRSFVESLLEDNLPPFYTYHNLGHTLYVTGKAVEIGQHEQCGEKELGLLYTAGLWHDTGYIHTYVNHEEAGCTLATQYLPGFGLKPDEIETICGMIMATKIPQSPKNKLEEIIADADLEYLGTEQAGTLAGALFHELRHLNPSLTEAEWNRTQVSFLENHHYFTSYCKKNKEPLKSAYLGSLVKKR